MPKEEILNRMNFSSEAMEIWSRLSPAQQWALRKDNPLRGDRDRIIYELRHMGKVNVELVSELSGLSRNQVIRISKRHPDLLINEIVKLRKEIRRLTERIERKEGRKDD